ncbi:unnamed protein product, partial [Didymodactylos carnosus]
MRCWLFFFSVHLAKQSTTADLVNVISESDGRSDGEDDFIGKIDKKRKQKQSSTFPATARKKQRSTTKQATTAVLRDPSLRKEIDLLNITTRKILGRLEKLEQ